jgi:hypothetical protein
MLARSVTGVCLISVSVLCATTLPSLLRSAALNAGTVLQVRLCMELCKGEVGFSYPVLPSHGVRDVEYTFFLNYDIADM